MPSFTNFYESLKEASMRLQNTVVLYDGEPYYVLCLDDHKKDDIFRVYLDPILPDKSCCFERLPGIPYNWYGTGTESVGYMMDAWMNNNPDSGILRKQMNSPLFNKFRPFPLGMLNSRNDVYFTERRPVRHMQQGLTGDMFMSYRVTEFRTGSHKDDYPSYESYGKGITASELYNMYKGNYPTLDEVLDNLKDPEVLNFGVAFDRKFAITRGPAGMLFLVYKRETVGILPHKDKTLALLSPEFNHFKQLIEEYSFFDDVAVM